MNRQDQAKALKKNRLLPELLEEQRQNLHEAWESADTPEQREALWHKLQATIDIRDHLYGRLEQLAGQSGA